MNEEAQGQITPGPGPAGPGPAQSQSPSPEADVDTGNLPGPGMEVSQAADTSDREKAWKKRVSTACLACKKSKRKCSGAAPCDNCRVFNRVCIFDESLDQRRRVAAKRTADELSYHRDLLNDLFRVIRAADEPRALRLLDIIRRDASTDEIRAYIDETLSILDSSSHSYSHGGSGRDTGTGTGTSIDTERVERIRTLHDARETLTVEGTGSSSFRRKVMDIHFLCDEAPYKVRAAPWTSVTQDDDLVSHLVSLYFTWDYPFYSVLDREVFVRHMVAGTGTNTDDSDFCSAFLVNAVLANACHFAEVSEAYVVPGDVVVQLGIDFLAEAERLRDQEAKKGPGMGMEMGIRLSSLQGTLLLYELYSLSGDDDLGYRMLHRALRMGESLGLVGEKQRERGREKVSFDLDVSLKRTAWGLFHIDTITHTGFLRPSLITKVNLPRIDRNMNPHELWTPYPSHRDPRPAYVSLFFDEACDLSAIAMDISRSLFARRQVYGRKRQLRDDLYERLRAWHDSLPEVFSMESKPPPYILLLRMRYHTLIINIFACTTDDYDDNISSIMSDAPQTPESPSSPVYKRHGTKTWDLPQSSAHAIAALIRLHRREYGMSRAHHFALYAVNLALFTLLEAESFDILDPDFLALASSFSVIAGRSHLGRNLFHLFRQSTRSKAQGKRIRDSGPAVPNELKDLFDENAVARGESRLDDYASGLEKLGQDERYHGLPGFSGDFEGDGLQNYPGLGLLDMLDRYESLSLGKDET